MQKIRVEREGPLAIIKFNDPDRRNAMDDLMRGELVESMTDAHDRRAR